MDIFDTTNRVVLIADKEYRLRQVIYETHDRLLALLLSLTADRQLCEDILQEAYIRFWNNMDKVEDDTTALFLLKRYTRNLFLDEMRKLARREALLVKMNFDDSTHTVEDIAITKERYTTMQAAIEKLPAQQRQIFRMHKEQALSYRQIAEQLGITPGTIETQMNRALKFLRKELADLKINDPAFTCMVAYYAISAHSSFIPL